MSHLLGFKYILIEGYENTIQEYITLFKKNKKYYIEWLHLGEKRCYEITKQRRMKFVEEIEKLDISIWDGKNYDDLEIFGPPRSWEFHLTTDKQNIICKGIYNNPDNWMMFWALFEKMCGIKIRIKK